MKLQIVSIPFFPNTSRKSWPIGRGSGESSKSETDAVAYEAEMYRSQPRDDVSPTPTRMAIGAARDAPAVSSEMWAAESSMIQSEFIHTVAWRY